MNKNATPKLSPADAMAQVANNLQELNQHHEQMQKQLNTLANKEQLQTPEILNEIQKAVSSLAANQKMNQELNAATFKTLSDNQVKISKLIANQTQSTTEPNNQTSQLKMIFGVLTLVFLAAMNLYQSYDRRQLNQELLNLSERLESQKQVQQLQPQPLPTKPAKR